jgi:phospholipase C
VDGLIRKYLIIPHLFNSWKKFPQSQTGEKNRRTKISARGEEQSCGNLSSAFRPYNGEKLSNPDFLSRDEFVESIHKAQFKNVSI